MRVEFESIRPPQHSRDEEAKEASRECSTQETQEVIKFRTWNVEMRVEFESIRIDLDSRL